MKKLLTLLFLSLFIVACEKDSGKGDGGDPGNGQCKLLIRAVDVYITVNGEIPQKKALFLDKYGNLRFNYLLYFDKDSKIKLDAGGNDFLHWLGLFPDGSGIGIFDYPYGSFKIVSDTAVWAVTKKDRDNGGMD